MGSLSHQFSRSSVGSVGLAARLALGSARLHFLVNCQEIFLSLRDQLGEIRKLSHSLIYSRFLFIYFAMICLYSSLIFHELCQDQLSFRANTLLKTIALIHGFRSQHRLASGKWRHTRDSALPSSVLTVMWMCLNTFCFDTRMSVLALGITLPHLPSLFG